MLLAKLFNRLLAWGALSVMLPAAITTRCWAEDPAPGKQVEQQKTVRNSQGQEVTVRYWLYLPKEYDGNQPFPLLLFLHGAGERGDDLKLVTKWGPPKLVAEGKQFPFILVSPQCPARQWWDADTLAHLVDDLAGSLKVDKERMYVTGLSMGGFGTWAILAKHPNLFAAAVPICGGGDPSTAEAIKHIPIWAFHGAKDNVVPLERSQQMVDAIKRVGGNAKLTVYPEAGHNSWSETYDNPEVYRWLLEHRRQ
ncbi:MAG: hydrolase [Pirellulaceae bacterium]|nr:MAG: hydrolase [Pirellulaceae bacterium]